MTRANIYIFQELTTYQALGVIYVYYPYLILIPSGKSGGVFLRPLTEALY